MERFNPFLPNAAVTELAKEGIDVYESFVASESDKLTAHANILGQGNDLIRAKYPVKPSARVLQPTEEEVKRILIGKQKGKQITIGNLLGRKNIKVKLDANKIVARHMAILAMTGGGKP